jgi:uncharacterized iron-regulated membrane protein
VAWLRALHRWVGLALAIIVVAVAATGGMLLFRDAYYRAVYDGFERPITSAQMTARADVLTKIEHRWRDAGITLIKFPREGVNAYQVWFADGSEAFVSPHDASVIDRWHWSERLPAFLFELHAHLLSDPTGSLVNGFVALVLVFMALTGILLWWPARRTAFRLRGAIPTRTAPGALLRSHAAVGAVSALPLLLFAGTGAAIVFYDQVEVVVTALLDTTSAEQPDARIATRHEPARAWPAIIDALDRTFPEGDAVFYYPGTPDNARLMFRKRLPGEWHPNGRSYVVIDPYSGEVVQAIDARTQGIGTRLMHAIYPLHAAKVGGTLMVLLAGFTAVTLTWLATSGAWAYLRRRAVRKGRVATHEAQRTSSRVSVTS